MAANHPSTIYVQASILPATSPTEDIQTSIGFGSYDGCLKFAWWIITMGRSFTLYSDARIGNRIVRHDPEGFPSDCVSLATAQWEASLKYMSTEWKISSAGCVLFVPLTVGLLQINAIFQNVLTRTAVVAAFIFAIAGLALSAHFMARLPQFNKRKCRKAWAKASHSCTDLESVEFWSVFALPMALLLWSAILCIATVLILAWTSQDVGGAFSDSRARAKTIVSASFLMVLAMTLAAFIVIFGSNTTNKHTPLILKPPLTITTTTAPFQTPSCARRRPSQDMLKLLRHPHSPLLCRPILHLAKSISSTRTPPPPEYTSLDAFRKHLRKRLDHEPTYALPSIFRRVELTARSTGQPAAVYEAAFDALLWRKRLADAASVLLHMPKKGVLASNATHAKMLAVSLASELPEEVTLENVLNNICDIVAHREYTAQDLAALLRIMKVYDVDRRAVALVPELVEAMVREGEVEGAFKMLEALDTPDAPVEVAYYHLLLALRDVCPWDAHLVDRILHGVAARGLPRQTPLCMLLAWAAQREQYLSVLHFYRILRDDPDVVCDARVFATLFEMHTTFLYRPAQTRFAPLAPRTLFREMELYFRAPPPPPPASPLPPRPAAPSTYLLSTALTAFLRQRDYAGALTALAAFRAHRTPLAIPAFYTTVKFLVHRAWGDLASRRHVRAGQIKWGDLFLGVRFGHVALGPGWWRRCSTACAASASTCATRCTTPAPRARAAPPAAHHEAGGGGGAGEEAGGDGGAVGAVRWYMPSMAEMESAEPDAPLVPRRGAVVGAAPLERLLERALLAEVQIRGELDVGRAEEAMRELVKQAREEMLGGLEEKDKAEKAEVDTKNEMKKEAETETEDKETKRKDKAEKEGEKDGTDQEDETEHPSETQEEP
ncbi:hypothetical protein BJ912DRAFT_1142882 [Pholiota molesta]|nr:hypothetical protein BJ912DRAFT_1142882 [Pholiota molesta]